MEAGGAIAGGATDRRRHNRRRSDRNGQDRRDIVVNRDRGRVSTIISHYSHQQNGLGGRLKNSPKDEIS
jgi:hypothetical protein